MMDYNSYGELYDTRPSLLIHERHRHSKTASEIIKQAKSKNFVVAFSSGGMRSDMEITYKDGSHRRPECYSLSNGLRYFNR